jgi:hypothetical protein
MTDSASAVSYQAYSPAESSSTIRGAAWDWGQAVVRRALLRVASPEQKTVLASEDMLQHLANEQPRVLISLLEASMLRPADLTFAAEVVGSVADSVSVVPLLARLLRHDSSVVREGAVYGLVQHASRVRAVRRLVREAIEALLHDEASPGVRAAAEEALDLLADQP